MKHSLFFPYAELVSKTMSIEEIAQKVILFYKLLSIEDSNFDTLYIVSERRSIYACIKIHEKKSVFLLAEEILNQNYKDIIKHDKILNPNIEHIRVNHSVIFSLETRIKGNTLCTLNFSFGSNLVSSIGAISVNEYCFNNFTKTYHFLKSIVKSFDVLYSVIKLKDREFLKKAREYKIPLGWISFFSNKYNINIPIDLKEVEYLYEDNGVFLILTKEFPVGDKTLYEKQCDKLLSLMKDISNNNKTLI